MGTDVRELRGAFVAISALITATAMAGALLIASGWQRSSDPGVLTTWYGRHAGALGWRALLVAVAAAGLVAFAASFRERTWAVVPDRLWAGTIMVLAALGYAALASVAGAVDLALLTAIRRSDPSPELLTFAAALQRSLVGLATPALIVVVLGTVIPLWRWGTPGRIAAVLGLGTAGLLTTPMTWTAGRYGVAAWLLVVGGVVLFASPSTAPLLRGVGSGLDADARPRPSEG